MRTEVESGTPLPEKGILFLGGHPNMTKKLRQQFPKWTFVSDDQLKKCFCANPAAVFYWTGHCSHKMMRYVYSKLPADTSMKCRYSKAQIPEFLLGLALPSNFRITRRTS